MICSIIFWLLPILFLFSLWYLEKQESDNPYNNINNLFEKELSEICKHIEKIFDEKGGTN